MMVSPGNVRVRAYRCMLSSRRMHFRIQIFTAGHFSMSVLYAWLEFTPPCLAVVTITAELIEYL